MSMPTLGRPYVPGPAPASAPSAKRRGVLLPVVGLVLLALLAVITIGVVQRAVGTAGVVTGTLGALLPVVPVVAAFLWVDQWEPEPPALLMGAFLWGAGFAALVALWLNTSASGVLDAAAGAGAGELFAPVVVAPFVEEFAKGLFVVGLLVFRRREFDGVIDGIVYAGITAAGFAFTENILYLGRAVSDPQTSGVLATLFVRGVASPFAHPLFTCMIGLAAGLGVGSRGVARRVLLLVGGYLAAVVLHGLWNGASVLAAEPGSFFQVYFFVMLPVFVGLVMLVVFARRREARIVAAQLPGFASAGWIAPSEVALLARLSRRKGWRTLVRRRSGRTAARAVADYQAAVTEMAFMRNRIARGAVRDSARAAHDEKLRALLDARARAIGRPDSAASLTAAWRVQPPPGWQPPPPPAADGSFSGTFRRPADLGGPAAGDSPGAVSGAMPPGPAMPGSATPGGRRSGEVRMDGGPMPGGAWDTAKPAGPVPGGGPAPAHPRPGATGASGPGPVGGRGQAGGTSGPAGRAPWPGAAEGRPGVPPQQPGPGAAQQPGAGGQQQPGPGVPPQAGSGVPPQPTPGRGTPATPPPGTPPPGTPVPGTPMPGTGIPQQGRRTPAPVDPETTQQVRRPQDPAAQDPDDEPPGRHRRPPRT
ncbi:PrsW family glutamic-type intramembrane protease [Pseudonocardia phyllosphaerae]|uniref:PrsW family glutamic-type intramembrane protease n=1 Tax=Pseudonocardia phyllosphaerae TaxID=3390502 RepID=UPI003978FA27